MVERTLNPPHPFPYQGSKRKLAAAILARVQRPPRTLFEPFAGSAAITIHAAFHGLSSRFVIGDALTPLADLWTAILERPSEIADGYEALWTDDAVVAERRYLQSRKHLTPSALLYVLARCVKAAVRFNRDGGFNQASDKRRLGMQPPRMRAALVATSALLRDRTIVHAAAFEQTLASATPNDLVYMDPPYEGTTTGRDSRYAAGLPRDRLIAALGDLRARKVPFLLSYDGRLGDKRYGEELPRELGLERIELAAGTSSQATLLGRDVQTIECLYVSQPTRKP